MPETRKRTPRAPAKRDKVARPAGATRATPKGPTKIKAKADASAPAKAKAAREKAKVAPANARAKAAPTRKRVRVESLRWAAQFGYLDEVKRFLAAGVSPDGDDKAEEGMPPPATPLEMACYHRKVPVVRVLLAAGASVHKGAPLRSAVTSGSKRTAELVRMLLDAGADPSAPGYRDGETVVDLCVGYNKPHLAEARAVLLEAIAARKR